MDKVNSNKPAITSSSGKATSTQKAKKKTSPNVNQSQFIPETLSSFKSTEIEENIKKRILALNPQSKEEFGKARKIIVEMCAILEFGDLIINDPKLPKLIKSVEHKITMSEELQERYDKYIKSLLR